MAKIYTEKLIYVINLSSHSSDPYTMDDFMEKFNNNSLIDYPHDHNWLYITSKEDEMRSILKSEQNVNSILQYRGLI